MTTVIQVPLRAGGLEIDDLHIQYGAHVALQRMSLRIAPGMIHGIIGPAGSGKTSFLRTLNRMSVELDGASVEGRVTLDGATIVGDDVMVDAHGLARLRRRMGIVFATLQPLPRSIYDNVAYGPRIAGIREKAALDDLVERSLRAVHM
ncbi:MAG: ATP-binding cassette domain-containing protein [Gemmatimonas sp.]|nr:ATP-binding cassette domain-containing protein [Gemmatimonas sp.]